MLLPSTDWPIYTKMDLLLSLFNSIGPVKTAVLIFWLSFFRREALIYKIRPMFLV